MPTGEPTPTLRVVYGDAKGHAFFDHPYHLWCHLCGRPRYEHDR